MSNPTSETVVATYEVRGRDFTVTRLTWRGTDGLSFDVADAATGTPLHNESFDNQPEVSDVDDLLATIATALDDNTLDPFLVGYRDKLIEIIASLDKPDTVAREVGDFEVSITRSAGDDGAVVVFIDGEFGDDDGVPLRVIVNNEAAPVYAEVEHESAEEERPARTMHVHVTNDDIAYLDGTEVPDSPAVLMTGNPVDGFTLTGPFRNGEDATRYADDHAVEADWWVVNLDAPAAPTTPTTPTTPTA